MKHDWTWVHNYSQYIFSHSCMSRLTITKDYVAISGWDGEKLQKRQRFSDDLLEAAKILLLEVEDEFL